MLKSVLRTPRFLRDVKALKKKHYDIEKLGRPISLIMRQQYDLLIREYRDHQLTGNWSGYRELHVESDWLLIYKVEKGELQLVLTRTGSHDELFAKSKR